MMTDESLIYVWQVPEGWEFSGDELFKNEYLIVKGTKDLKEKGQYAEVYDPQDHEFNPMLDWGAYGSARYTDKIIAEYVLKHAETCTPQTCDQFSESLAEVDIYHLVEGAVFIP